MLVGKNTLLGRTESAPAAADSAPKSDRGSWLSIAAGKTVGRTLLWSLQGLLLQGARWLWDAGYLLGLCLQGRCFGNTACDIRGFAHCFPRDTGLDPPALHSLGPSNRVLVHLLLWLQGRSDLAVSGKLPDMIACDAVSLKLAWPTKQTQV